MVLTALRGGVGFLTRIPVGQSSDAWEAFAGIPAVFPLVGYLLGAAVALPVLLAVTAVPPVVVAGLALPWLYLLAGITHADGLADLADAAVVHGDPDDRVEVLTDATTGVGGTVAVVLVFVGTALGLVGVAGLPVRQAVAVVVATEVGAKLAMAGIACLGTAAFEGLGAALTEPATWRQLPVATGLALPAAALAWPTLAATGALLGAVAAGGLLAAYASRLLDGVNGDVFGAANEVGRFVGLNAGVIAWTLS
ncbi:MAG: adenosylcobinamide-GDP ribazoletransferase [Haloarculaceae archaeon]